MIKDRIINHPRTVLQKELHEQLAARTAYYIKQQKLHEKHKTILRKCAQRLFEYGTIDSIKEDDIKFVHSGMSATSALRRAWFALRDEVNAMRERYHTPETGQIHLKIGNTEFVIKPSYKALIVVENIATLNQHHFNNGIEIEGVHYP